MRTYMVKRGDLEIELGGVSQHSLKIHCLNLNKIGILGIPRSNGHSLDVSAKIV